MHSIKILYKEQTLTVSATLLSSYPKGVETLKEGNGQTAGIVLFDKITRFKLNLTQLQNELIRDADISDVAIQIDGQERIIDKWLLPFVEIFG